MSPLYTEDFILRMISQAVAVLAQVLFHKQAGQRQEALQAVDQALELLTGLRAPLLRQLDEARMLELLVLQGRLDVDRLAVLADIFTEEAEILEQEGRAEESLHASRRALRFQLESCLVIYAPDLAGMPPETMLKVEALRRRLESSQPGVSDLPLETRLALLDYYERLAALPDDKLAAASLSRETVTQTWESFQKTLGV